MHGKRGERVLEPPRLRRQGSSFINDGYLLSTAQAFHTDFHVRLSQTLVVINDEDVDPIAEPAGDKVELDIALRADGYVPFRRLAQDRRTAMP